MTNSWLNSNLDFLNLWYAVNFIALASFCWVIGFSAKRHMSIPEYELSAEDEPHCFLTAWRWMGFALFSYGLFNLSMGASISYVNFYWLRYLGYGFMALTILFMRKFNTEATEVSDVKPYKTKASLVFGILLTALMSYLNLEFFVYGLLASFSLPVVFYSLKIIIELSGSRKEPYIKHIFCCLIIHFCLKLIYSLMIIGNNQLSELGSIPIDIVAPTLLWSLSILNYAITVFVWLYLREYNKVNFLFSKVFSFVIVPLLALSCFWFFTWRVELVHKDEINNLSGIALRVAKDCKLEELEEDFARYPNNNSTKRFCQIRDSFNQFAKLKRSISGITTIWQKNHKFYIGPSSNVNPGQVVSDNWFEHKSLPRAFKLAYGKGEPIVFGPFNDEFGEFVAVAFPKYRIAEKSGITCMVSVFVTGDLWRIKTLETRTFVLTFVFFVWVAPFFFGVLAFYRKEDEKGFWGNHSFPVFTFFFTLFITIVVFFSLKHHGDINSSVAFRRVAVDRSNSIQEQMDKLDYTVYNLGRRIIELKPFNSQEFFNRVASSLTLKSNYFYVSYRPITKGSEIKEKFPNFKLIDSYRTKEYEVDPDLYYYPAQYEYCPEGDSSSVLNTDYNDASYRRTIQECIDRKEPQIYCSTDMHLGDTGRSGIVTFIPIEENGKVNAILRVCIDLNSAVSDFLPEHYTLADTVGFEAFDIVDGKRSPLMVYPDYVAKDYNKYIATGLRSTYLCMFGKKSIYLTCFALEKKDFGSIESSLGKVSLMIGFLMSIFAAHFVAIGQKKQGVLVGEIDRKDRAIQEQKLFLENLSKNIKGTIFRFDIEDHYNTIFVSRDVGCYVGVTADEFLSKKASIFDVVSPEDLKKIKKCFEDAILRREAKIFDFRAKNKQTGKIFWTNCRLQPFIINGTAMFLDCVMLDIDQAKKEELKVLEAKKNLEKANKELRLTNEKATELSEEAMNANETKSYFLTTLSHKIRTPMNDIIGLSSLLLSTNLNDDQKQNAELISTSSETLLALLNDIFDVTKLDTDELTLENIDFDLQKLLQDTIKMLDVRAREKSLKLSFKIDEKVPCQLVGDSGRIRQILINLINNSIKYTAKGSVDLSVNCLSKDNNTVLLKFIVSDTGIGISKEACKTLFEPYSQAEASTTRKYGGTGLGLNICKKFAKLFGGEIGVESELGAGSDFWFTAKLRFKAKVETVNVLEQRSINRGVEVGSMTDKRILYVEDNKTNQKVALAMLKRLGYTADIANDGSEGIRALSEKAYDLVLMDCQMPVMDGFEATRRIRAGEDGVANPKIPIVAVTANAMTGDREKCLDSGMDDYMAKPVQIPVLKEMLEKWLH